MPCCHLCRKTYTVASLPGHLKKCHCFNNVRERKHMLNLCNKRTYIRRCPCPVPGCGIQGQFLERHMEHVHKELDHDQLETFKDLARRQETDRLLLLLRDTNPEIPLTTTWDNLDQVEDCANQPATRHRPCHKPGCQALQQRFLALQRNWRWLKAEHQKAKRELWALRRPSGDLGLAEAERYRPGNGMRTIPVTMSFDQRVESRLQVKMNSPDSSSDISIKQEEPEDHSHLDQCVESRLQVKMNSPDSSRDISIKQEEPEDHPHLEVSPKQESSPCLLQDEPEPPPIKEEEEELLLQRPEEPAGSMLTLLAVQSEEGDEDISSHCFGLESDTEDTEDSDDWDETSGGQVASNTSSITRKSSFSSTHTGEKPFRCTLCNKCFTTSRSLNRHQHIHTGEKPFHCPFCGKSFRDLGEVENHQRVHTGEKPFCCTLCDKCYTTSRSLKIHQRIHTGVPL